MKAFSLLTTLALAALAISGADAAKCAAKSAAPSTASKAPAPAQAPAPAASSKAPAAAPAPAGDAPAPAPAAGEGDGKAGTKSAGCGKASTLKTGTFKATVNGKQREYMLRVPENYDSSKAYKLIITFHWRGGTMQDAARNAGGWYGLAALAKESAIFVAPQGLNNGWPDNGGEDMQFVDAIVKAMDDGLCVDQSKRFTTGFSWGAGMSHAVACARPDKFRAVSLIAGGLISGCTGGTKPVAYQLMHGNNDNVLSPTMGKQIMETFVKANGCTPQNAPLPASGSGTHIKTEYKGCKPGYPVIFTGFDGGHVAEPSDRGKPNFAPAETWAFFTQFD
jgi:poly(3-hydroxybutyrate) depolymerase